MFGFRSKNVIAQTATSVAEGLKYTSGNVVVIARPDSVLGVRLESGADRPAGSYGPEDGLGMALGDVLRHLTGTPVLDTSGDEKELEAARVDAQEAVLRRLLRLVLMLDDPRAVTPDRLEGLLDVLKDGVALDDGAWMDPS